MSAAFQFSSTRCVKNPMFSGRSERPVSVDLLETANDRYGGALLTGGA
jgi:hypothetical protein